jgi:hypothetical protein
MDANITISLQEFPDLGGTMSREIIGDDMNFLCRGLASNDLLEKATNSALVWRAEVLPRTSPLWWLSAAKSESVPCR